jgi:WD40 repeat protein
MRIYIVLILSVLCFLSMAPTNLSSTTVAAAISPLATPTATTDTALITVVNAWQVKELAAIEGTTAYALAISPDGSSLALGGYEGKLQLFDVKTLQVSATLTSGSGWSITSLAFSPDGEFLVVGMTDGPAWMWHVQTGRQVASYGRGGVDDLGFSPDGKLLVGRDIGEFAGVHLWDVATGKELSSVSDGSENYILSVVFSPDGKRLALGYRNGVIHIVDIATQRKLAVLKDQEWTINLPISSAAFSPDGRLLASVRENGEVGLWDMNTYEELPSLKGHTDQINSVAFSPDGTILVSASSDQSIRLWDLTTGKDLAVLAGHTAEVLRVVFSPDGMFLASTSTDKTVRLWGIPVGS